MNFTRKGVVTIAGQSCTDWRVLNGSAEEGTACVTDDGLVLRATRNKPSEGAIVAIDVRYGPPSAGSFTPPPDFRLLLPVQKGTPPATGAKPP
jgi:hypothetical protein